MLWIVLVITSYKNFQNMKYFLQCLSIILMISDRNESNDAFTEQKTLAADTVMTLAAD